MKIKQHVKQKDGSYLTYFEDSDMVVRTHLKKEVSALEKKLKGKKDIK